jgi:hypothetical protein
VRCSIGTSLSKRALRSPVSSVAFFSSAAALRKLRAMFLKRGFAVVLFCALNGVFAAQINAAEKPHTFSIRSNDVVAFVGGSDVAAAQFSGHIETLLALRFPGARFRNFGWEGDTVFGQPRDVGFPPFTEHLRRAGATLLLIQWGRGEALDGRAPVAKFQAASEKFALDCAKIVPRIVLVTPAPFENAPPPLPDLSSRNLVLSNHVNAIRELGAKHGWPVVDAFDHLANVRKSRLTSDGWQLTPRGHVLFAEGFMWQTGFGQLLSSDQNISEDGAFLASKELEALRQLVLEKNRFWINYWRPHNWAFLGGDRTTQPSSRDHRDPGKRWMPDEMEKFLPLIRQKEEQIEKLASEIRGEKR